MASKKNVKCREKTQEKERLSFSERLCRSLDIQPDILPYGTLIEIRGRSSVTLRGCGRVKVYTDTTVSFATRRGTVSVKGRGLCCTSYRKGAAVIDGIVDGVYFEGVAE